MRTHLKIIQVLFLFFFIHCYSNIIENKGQLKDSKGNKCQYIRAYTQNQPVNFYIHENGNLSFVLNQIEKSNNEMNFLNTEKLKRNVTQYRLDLKFISNLVPTIEFDDKQENYNHFYFDNQKYEFLYNYKSIYLREIYKNIDLKIKIDNDKIKYDFIVNPGGNPSDIKYYFDGSLETKLNSDGSLIIKTDLGDLFDSKPVSFQENIEIKSNYKLENNIISYQIEDYDTSKQLIIDPIIWSTYLGGSLEDQSVAIDRDAVIDNNNLVIKSNYICGITESLNFPLTIGNSSTAISSLNSFISKYNEESGVLNFTIQFGLNYEDIFFRDIAVVGKMAIKKYSSFTHQNFKSIIVCGSKSNAGFYYGLVGSFDAQTGVHNYTVYKDACVLTKLARVNFGKNTYDKIYITGYVPSDFSIFFHRTSDAYQHHFGGGSEDALLLKVKISDGATLYSTFLGGNWEDRGTAIEVYKNPNSNVEQVFVAGQTNSDSGLASSNAPISAFNGGFTDAFLSSFKFNVSSVNVYLDQYLGLAYSTYFGGSKRDIPFDLKIDEDGANRSINPINQIHMVGATWSADFPLVGQNPFQNYFAGVSDGFVSTFDFDSGICKNSSFFGADGEDYIRAVNSYRVNNEYYLEILGHTTSDNLPTTFGAYRNNKLGQSDGFLSVLKTEDLNNLFYSTYFGSDSDNFGEYLLDLTKTNLNKQGMNDAPGELSFTGFSTANYPVQSANNGTYIAQPYFSGNSDAVITRFSYKKDLSNKIMENSNLFNEKNIIVETNYNVFPNPFNDNIEVTHLNGIKCVDVIDLNNRIIKQFTFNNETTVNLGLSDLLKGVYFLKIISSEKNIEFYKVIKN